LAWFESLSENDLIVFSNGSQLPPLAHSLAPRKGYGYAIYQKEKLLCIGHGKFHNTSVVFDAKAFEALQDLRITIALPKYHLQQIIVCLDNTAVIWCLKNNLSLLGYRVFTAFHRITNTEPVNVKWSPGHINIESNEIADEQAKLGAKSLDIDIKAQFTLTGLRSIERKLLQVATFNT